MTTTTYTRDDTGEMLAVRVIDHGVSYIAAMDAINQHTVATVDRIYGAAKRRLWQAVEAIQAEALNGARLPKHWPTVEDLIARRNRPEQTAEWPVQVESVKWAELPSETPPPLEVRPDVPTRVEPHDPPDLIGLGMGPALRGRYGTKGGPSPFDPTPAPDEAMPGRVALTPRDNPLAAAYAEREARGWTPDPAYYGPHPSLEPTPEGSQREQIVVRRVRRALTEVEGELGELSHVRAGGAVDWRAEWAGLKADLARPLRWWRRKQAQRDQRMGAGE